MCSTDTSAFAGTLKRDFSIRLQAKEYLTGTLRHIHPVDPRIFLLKDLQ